MRVSRALSVAVALAGFTLAGASLVWADGPKPLTKKQRKERAKVSAPSAPSGKKPVVDAYYGGTQLDTIHAFQNSLGQTVYSIAASHWTASWLAGMTASISSISWPSRAS